MPEQILIVDDCKTNQQLLIELCKSMDIYCETADNGEMALRKSMEREYSVYLVDLMMPVMDGKSFIKKLKEISPDSIIMVQTALDSAYTIIEIMKLGVFDYIIKPIDFETFRTVLERCLEFKRLKNLEKDHMKRFQAELAKVRQIQAALQPKFGSVTGFDIESSLFPVEDLSGDFLDGYYVDEDIFQIVLCDVSGHGIASAYIGMEIKSIFRTFSTEKLSPSALIEKANRQMIRDISHTYFFATVLVCQINTRNGSVTLSSGGHPSPLYYSSGPGELISLNIKGPLIGVSLEKKFSDIPIDMKSGDVLLLYTDGIPEAPGVDGKSMYEKSRLNDKFMEMAGFPSIDIIHSIIESVYAFTGYSPQQDDITIVSIKKL